ncbi:MAG: Hsp70 family protein [Desulfomonile tiedjei]|nr:Hsp70 family protein [Desulfomonile tiedjei]
MAGRLAIDFGTSNTRTAVWDDAVGEARSLPIPDVSLKARHEDADHHAVEVPYIPSLISYAGKQVWIGKQVKEKGLADSQSTFRWMKRYISNRLEIPRRIDGRSVKVSEAGADFLLRVLVYAAEAIDLGDEEVAFTVPVEAFEHYQDWLTRVCDQAGIKRYRLLDEASAAALGYGIQLQADSVYMVFDFGGGTLDVSIVRMEKEAQGGKRCSVLGKGGAEVGGTTIDQWLFRDLCARTGRKPDDVRHISGLLLMEVERAKEALTTADSAEITVVDPQSGEIMSGRYSRSEFEDLLDENGLFETLQAAVGRALASARERGYEAEHIEAVLLIGGSSLIPSVRRSVRQMFGRKVKTHRPLDAVVLGAAAFVGGAAFYDHVQHEYALRYYSREKGEHEYFTIVQPGTPYPTAGSICQVTVRASYDDQEFLGLEIYELGRKECFSCGDGPLLDLVFDPSGAARFQQREEPEIISRFWVNEKCPTFIHARPKSRRGEKRFPVQFSVDGNKRLCVAVRDLLTGQVLMKDHPLIKLT